MVIKTTPKLLLPGASHQINENDFLFRASYEQVQVLPSHFTVSPTGRKDDENKQHNIEDNSNTTITYIEAINSNEHSDNPGFKTNIHTLEKICKI